MSVIKITRDNTLNIPIGTLLHYRSFFNHVKKGNSDIWDSIGCFIWKDSDNSLHIIDNDDIYLNLGGCYINCICLNMSKEFIYEGDEYWKVFISEEHVRSHKLEFDGKKHSQALLFKPYKDKVHSNTNFMANDCQRFKTEKEAIDYCLKILDNISID